jgi:RimJ/RimL family protein N-acetyltransferase
MSDYDWIPDDLDGFRVVLETQKVDMHGSFVAIMDDMPVATAWLSRMDADKDWCIHVLTGTRRDYRRRGLVRGLKQHGFAWCSEVGIKTIYTSQQHTNEAMLRLNQSLGFKITATHLIYCKMI